MSEIVPLSLLRSGARGAIDQVSGQPNEVQRMQELGLSAGCEIEVLQEGCPCIVKCKETRYCLRGNDCNCIWVRIGEPS